MMITNALNKFYSDHYLTQHKNNNKNNTICSSILKKFHLKNNEKVKMIRKEDLRFKNEIQIETNSSSVDKDILITNYLSQASIQNHYEYKINFTDCTTSIKPGDDQISQFLNDEKNISSYNLNKIENNLSLKQKISNKLKEFSSSKTAMNEFDIFNFNTTSNNNNNSNNDGLRDHNSISPNRTNFNLSEDVENIVNECDNENYEDYDDDECCSNCSVTNTINRLSMFDEQTFNNNSKINNRMSQSDNDLTYSIDNNDETNLKENNPTKTESKIFGIIDIQIHRLPGENMGMDFSVQNDGYILVENIVENGAACRAVQSNGVRCPIKQYDEIIEINNVSLNNMKPDEIISMISELPLFLQVKIRRQSSELSISSNEDSSTHNNAFSENVPFGYHIHSLLVSSMDSINSCDFEHNLDGYFKFIKSSSSNKEKKLNEGDVLYQLNEDLLINLAKNDLINKLKSINQNSELKLFRKLNMTDSKTSSNPEEIPYYNGIFAKNSIKLAVRSSNYDKANVIKFNKLPNKPRKKLFDFINNSEELHSKIEAQEENLNNFLNTLPVDTEINTANLNDQNRSDNTTSKFDSCCNNDNNNNNNETNTNKKKEDLFCLSDQTLTSIHDDNWIFLDRKPSSASSSSNCSSLLAKNSSQNQLDDTNDFSNEFFFAKQNGSKQESTSPSSSSPGSSFEAGTIKCLTNSSCHSERSIARIKCLTLYEDNLNEDKQTPELDILKVDSSKLNDTFLFSSHKPPESQPSSPLIEKKFNKENETIFHLDQLEQTSQTMTTTTTASNRQECLIVKRFFNKLKSISEEKSVESNKNSQEMKSINSSNKSITHKYELCDLKRFMHDELIQLITDNKTEAINHYSHLQQQRDINTPSSSSSSPNKLNSLIKKIQAKGDDDRANEIEKKIHNFQQQATVLSHVVDREIFCTKPESSRSTQPVIKNSNKPSNILTKQKDAAYVDSAYNQQNKKKTITQQQMIKNESNLSKQTKALSSPSLIEDQKIQLSVKEKIKLFMNQSKPETSRQYNQLNLNNQIKFNPKIDNQPKPLSQVLIESLHIKNNIASNKSSNLSISTNKLNKTDLNYAKVHSFRCNNYSNKLLEPQTSQIEAKSDNDKHITSPPDNNDELNFKSVKDKIAYFTSLKYNSNNNKNDFLIKNLTKKDFRKRY